MYQNIPMAYSHGVHAIYLSEVKGDLEQLMSRKRQEAISPASELVSLSCVVFLTPVARILKYPALSCQPGSASYVVSM